MTAVGLDDFGDFEFRFDLYDFTLDSCLLVLRRVVFRVIGKVAEIYRYLDSFGYFGTFDEF